MQMHFSQPAVTKNGTVINLRLYAEPNLDFSFETFIYLYDKCYA